MRCTSRAAVAALSGLLFVLITSPAATAAGQVGVLELQPNEGLPGSTYQLAAANVKCLGNYELEFEKSNRSPLPDPGVGVPTWSRTVPNDAEPGPHAVDLYCVDEPVVVNALAASTLIATGTFEVLPPLVQTVDVPDLQDKTALEAEQALTDVGLRLGKVTGGKGRVIEQFPSVGTPVQLESTVDIVLSVVRVPVPRLIGRTVDEAKELLKPDGLILVGATRDGRIATQDPDPGVLVEPNSEVRVTLRGIVPPSSPTPSKPSQSTSPSSSASVRPTPSLTSGGSPTVPPGAGGRTGGWILLGASGGAGGLLVLAFALLISRTAIRARERQWIRKHVHAVPRLGDDEPPELRTDPRFPTSAIRLEPHQDTGTHVIDEERR